MNEPDRRRWGDPRSYRTEWGERARRAASLFPDGATVLEIGVGTGTFRDAIRPRTRYLGADLEPLDAATIALDLDRDPLPKGPFDYIVLLGVLSYLHEPDAAARKVCAAANHVIVSYCCRSKHLAPDIVAARRKQRGWLNSFDQPEFIRMFARQGHEIASRSLLHASDELDEYLMTFRRAPGKACL